jgi:hypothetical protein
MSDLVIGLVSAGGGGLLGIVGTFLVMRHLTALPKCPHDRIVAHSFEQYVNVTYARAICRHCGKALKFDLGYVANAKGALHRAARVALEARGYVLLPDVENTFERKQAA